MKIAKNFKQIMLLRYCDIGTETENYCVISFKNIAAICSESLNIKPIELYLLRTVMFR